MADIAKNGNPSLSTVMPSGEAFIAGDLFAGEDIQPGDACFISAVDNLVYKAFAATTPKGIEEINLTNNGNGYINPPLVTISAPDAGSGTLTQATAEAVVDPLNGAISHIVITNAGAGYVAPTVTITPVATDPAPVEAAVAVATLQDDGATQAEASWVHGFAPGRSRKTQAITLMSDVNFAYGNALTPGKPVYLSALNPGAISLTQTGSLGSVGFTIDAQRIRLYGNR